jgi:cytidylate kinase
VLIDGVDATDAIRSDSVDHGVPVVASIPEVRTALLARQRAMAAEGGIVVVGRDIGTVVLPDAPLKIFLDASVEARASRRIAERGLDPAGEEAGLVREQLRSRDHRDSTRAVAPLRAAADAVHVANEGSFEEAVDAVVAAIEAAAKEGTA